MFWLLVAILVLAVLIYRGQQAGAAREVLRQDKDAVRKALVDERVRAERERAERDVRQSPAFSRMRRACLSAGYDVPTLLTDPGWDVLQAQLHDDLGGRWSGSAEVPDAEAVTLAIETHARALRRLNRIRRSLGFGRVVPSPTRSG